MLVSVTDLRRLGRTLQTRRYVIYYLSPRSCCLGNSREVVTMCSECSLPSREPLTLSFGWARSAHTSNLQPGRLSAHVKIKIIRYLGARRGCLFVRGFEKGARVCGR